LGFLVRIYLYCVSNYVESRRRREPDWVVLQLILGGYCQTSAPPATATQWPGRQQISIFSLSFFLSFFFGGGNAFAIKYHKHFVKSMFWALKYPFFDNLFVNLFHFRREIRKTQISRCTHKIFKKKIILYKIT